eukprot:CAMPEP_0115089766 /NCGR_PEP_ID=MMETSP0227-20121206/24933_1 /TAXON_ID=89957 /ORGANISM="Polarella glacialis, Strain CCMP 1383" /LENGTH=509 /DNA_ID=CAMNT_0002480591 /DNA_START=91 /DNA_END=1620 /DNA_ORIENTATION=+
MEKLTLLTRGQAVGLGQSKEDLAHQLSVLGRKGEQNAADHGYAASVANMASDREEEVAARAIAALGDMGQEGAKHLDVVADGLTRGPKVCVAAAIAIGQFGRQAARCEDQLVRCMDSGEEAVRAAAIAALGAIGAEKQAHAACQALGKFPNAGIQEASRIAKKLEEPALRYAAVCALASLGASIVEKYIDEIAPCLQDKDSLTRLAAATALGVASAAVLGAASGAPRIAELLKNQDPGVRCAAALALGKLGHEASSYAADIAVLLDDDIEDSSESYLTIGGGSLRSPATLRRPKCAALAALGLLGAERYASSISDALTDKSYEVKLCALDSMTQLGAAGRRMSSAVGNLLADDLYVVRVKACQCLAALEAEEEMSSLVDLLEDSAPSVRQAALKALASRPEVAKSFSEEVFKCLGDGCSSVRVAAITTLGLMGLVGQSYASLIAMELNGQDPEVRAAACEALGRLGDHGAAFQEEISLCLQDSVPLVRSAATRSLELMGAQVTKALTYG